MTLLWSIGSPDVWSSVLVNTYAAPDVTDVVWRVPSDDAPPQAQAWPAFHASEADPNGGYRPHPYTVEFTLGAVPPAARLRVYFLVTTPRVGYLAVQVNGAAARVYLHPTPYSGDEVWPLNGLHSSILADGVADLLIPGAALRPGLNRLVLTCRDDGPLTRFTNPQKIARLDRIATGAGFFYQCLQLEALPTLPTSSLLHARVKPSVVYRRAADGGLVEHCRLYLELGRALPATRWTLDLADDQSQARHAFTTPAGFGHVCHPFEVFDGDGPVRYRLTAQVDGTPVEVTGEFVRRRKWEVYVTPHAHTDIGYTHRQWEVAERLCRNIDAALDLLQAHGGQGMAYHLDASWALETYLKTRSPERIAQLKQAVRDGHIGVAGNYGVVLTQFAALEDLVRNHEFSADFLADLTPGPVFDASIDVPSLTSSLPDVLAGLGVRGLVLAANQDRGPSRLNGQLHRRSPFTWQGRAGGQVVVWWAKMYCELRKVCGSPPDLATAEAGLSLWLDEFETPDYPLDSVLLYGQEADNTDLDPQPIEFVHQWNAAYAYPRLVLSDLASFFARVEAAPGDRPVVEGDLGAYWEDGVGSSMAATVQARAAQASLPAAERLAALAALHQPELVYPRADFDAAWRELLLYDEHTWGAFLSGPDPDALLQADQWAVKAGFAAQAEAEAARLLHSAVTRHTLALGTTGREVVVFNPHSWTVSGAVLVETALGEQALDPASAQPVPQRVVRRLNTQQWVELWVDALPGLSYRRYELGVGVPTGDLTGFPNLSGLNTLENDHYRLVFDPARGCAVSWTDKALGRELVDAADRWGFGQAVYVLGGAGTRLESNRASWPDGQAVERGDFSLEDWAVETWAWGSQLRLTGQTAAGRLTATWTLGPSRAVDVCYTLDKTEQRDKEAVYIAFPLALPAARVLSDSQLGWTDWQRDRLPGACLEWLPLQTGVRVEGGDAHVAIASPDVPLFCVGDRVQGRWPKDLDLTGGRVFSYVLNNYWSTNYKPVQSGRLAFRYRLTSDRTIAPDAAYRLGWEARRPLYAHRVSLQEFRHPAPPYADPTGGCLAEVTPESVVVTTLRAARHAPGLVLRLQETAGVEQTATVRLPGRRVAHAWATDLLERPLAELAVAADGSLRVPVPAWGLATIRLELVA